MAEFLPLLAGIGLNAGLLLMSEQQLGLTLGIKTFTFSIGLGTEVPPPPPPPPGVVSGELEKIICEVKRDGATVGWYNVYPGTSAAKAMAGDTIRLEVTVADIGADGTIWVEVYDGATLVWRDQIFWYAGTSYAFAKSLTMPNKIWTLTVKSGP